MVLLPDLVRASKSPWNRGTNATARSRWRRSRGLEAESRRMGLVLSGLEAREAWVVMAAGLRGSSAVFGQGHLKASSRCNSRRRHAGQLIKQQRKSPPPSPPSNQLPAARWHPKRPVDQPARSGELAQLGWIGGKRWWRSRAVRPQHRASKRSQQNPCNRVCHRPGWRAAQSEFEQQGNFFIAARSRFAFAQQLLQTPEIVVTC